GRWSTGGQFEKSDFGGWREIWTVGGKLASPAIQFSVNAPCLPGGQGQSVISGPNIILSCETPGQYHTGIIQDLIAGGTEMRADRISLQSSRGGLGDETADLISKLIGVN